VNPVSLVPAYLRPRSRSALRYERHVVICGRRGCSSGPHKWSSFLCRELHLPFLCCMLCTACLHRYVSDNLKAVARGTVGADRTSPLAVIVRRPDVDRSNVVDFLRNSQESLVGEALLQGRTSTVMANLQIMAQVRHAGADTSALVVGGSALWQSHPLWSCGGKDFGWGLASCSCMR
jgi:hypothetical protein